MHGWFTNLLKETRRLKGATKNVEISPIQKQALKKRFESLKSFTHKVYTKEFAKIKKKGLGIESDPEDLAKIFTGNVYDPLLTTLDEDNLTFGKLFEVIDESEFAEGITFVSATRTTKKEAAIIRNLDLAKIDKDKDVMSKYGFIGVTKLYKTNSGRQEEKDIAKLLLEIASPTLGTDQEALFSPLADKLLGTTAEMQTADGEILKLNLYKLYTMTTAGGGEEQYNAVIEMREDPDTISKNSDAIKKFREFLKLVREKEHNNETWKLETENGIEFSIKMGAAIKAGAHTKCTNASASIDEKGSLDVKAPKTAFESNQSNQSALGVVSEVSNAQATRAYLEVGVAMGASRRVKEKPGKPKDPEKGPSENKITEKSAAAGPKESTVRDQTVITSGGGISYENDIPNN